MTMKIPVLQIVMRNNVYKVPNTVPGTHRALENVMITVYQIPVCYLFPKFMGTSDGVVFSQTIIQQECQGSFINFIIKRNISNFHEMALWLSLFPCFQSVVNIVKV